MTQPRDSKTIRSIVLLLVACASHTVAIAQGLSLQTGDSYLFTFDSMSYLQPQQFPFPYEDRFRIRHPAGTLAEGDSYKLELFTNLASAPSVTVWAFGVQPSGHPYVVEAGPDLGQFTPPLFPDLRGAARVTVESGDVDIEGFYIQQVVNGQVFAQYFPVPEPSTVVLGGIGVVVLGMLNRWRRK